MIFGVEDIDRNTLNFQNDANGTTIYLEHGLANCPEVSCTGLQGGITGTGASRATLLEYAGQYNGKECGHMFVVGFTRVDRGIDNKANKTTESANSTQTKF